MFFSENVSVHLRVKLSLHGNEPVKSSLSMSPSVKCENDWIFVQFSFKNELAPLYGPHISISVFQLPYLRSVIFPGWSDFKLISQLLFPKPLYKLNWESLPLLYKWLNNIQLCWRWEGMWQNTCGFILLSFNLYSNFMHYINIWYVYFCIHCYLKC